MKAPAWIVVVGASAGGVQALGTFFSGIPADIDAGFLVVLHIPPHTESHLDAILARHTSLAVQPSSDCRAIESGHVYVGRADMHLTVNDGAMRLTRGPKECRARPSIDVLFRSASVAYGPRVVGVVLSGMLDDGTAGLWAIKERHGRALVQDPADAMHASMPASALRHVRVDLVDSARALAAEVTRIAQTEAERRDAHTQPELHAVENEIAVGGNALELGVMKMGVASQYTCPECHGVLVQIEEGSIVRFRCHTGHAFSPQSLLADVNQTIDKALWDTIRAGEERILLLRQFSRLAADRGDSQTSADYERLAAETEAKIKPVRDLVLDETLLGTR